MTMYATCEIECSEMSDITTGCNTPESVGEVFQSGNEDCFLIQGVVHEIARACDPQSGQPTSAALHKALKVIKMTDKSSPMLYQALCTPVKLEKVIIKWYRNCSTGKEHYFTTTLEDCYVASVTAIKKNSLDVSSDNIDYDVPDMEEVTFTYKTCTWDHDVSSVSYSWDWNAHEA